MRFGRSRLLHVALTGLALLAACGTPGADPADGAQVRAVVEGFGGRLGLVSLLAPSAAEDIRAQYAPYVAPALLDQWGSDPSQAPGRVTSSPWPDRIEIDTITRVNASEYSVTGRVVEITSVEETNGGSAYQIPVQITVNEDNGRWQISAYDQEDAAP